MKNTSDLVDALHSAIEGFIVFLCTTALCLINVALIKYLFFQ